MATLTACHHKQGKSPPPQTVQAVIAVSLAAIVLIGIAVALPIAVRRHNRAIRQYSGAETDPAVHLQYDETALGDYKTVSSKLREDGRYHEELLAADGAVTIRLWRDFERPKMSLELQSREKYPDLRGYSGEWLSKNALVSQRGRFTTQEADSTVIAHTVVLLRKGGWDYLADFSVNEKDRKTYADYIDSLIETMAFI